MVCVCLLNVVIWSTKLVTSGFRREVDENCALPGYYAESNGNSPPTFRETFLKVQDLLTFRYGTDRLSRNVGKELQLPAA